MAKRGAKRRARYTPEEPPHGPMCRCRPGEVCGEFVMGQASRLADEMDALAPAWDVRPAEHQKTLATIDAAVRQMSASEPTQTHALMRAMNMLNIALVALDAAGRSLGHCERDEASVQRMRVIADMHTLTETLWSSVAAEARTHLAGWLPPLTGPPDA